MRSVPADSGSGAFYFAATGVRYSYQLYLSELTVRIKSRDRGRSLTLGRMPFSSASAFARSKLESAICQPPDAGACSLRD